MMWRWLSERKMNQFHLRLVSFVSLWLLLSPGSVRAQDMNRVLPAGGQRGTSVSLTFPGMAMVESAALVVDGEGVKPLGPFAKGAGKVEIAPDAAPGIRQIRLVGPKSATTPRPFAVSTLPEVQEQEPNDTSAQAQAIGNLPVTLNGEIPKGQDTDLFRVRLKKGDFLVVAGESRRVASPIHLSVHVRDLQGREVPFGMDLRRRDPVFTCTIPADGDYLVQFHEITGNMGEVGEGTFYRVTLTTGPWLDFVTPPGARRGATAHLTFHGWNLGGKPGPGAVQADVPVPADAAPQYPVSTGSAPNQVPLAAGDGPETEEMEPNQAPASPQSVTLPVTLNGAFGTRGDVDVFQFPARAKEAVLLDVTARELDSLADPVLILRDSAGKTLLTVDDAGRGRDPEAVWTAPADGTYTVLLRDLAGVSRGGPSSFYRLLMAPARPELRLVAREATVTLKPGAKAELPLTLYQSYQPGEVTIRVEGLPAGVSADPVTVPASPARQTTTQSKVVLTAAANAAPGHAVIRVLASASSVPAPAVALWERTGDGGSSLGTGTTGQLLVLVTPP
jgi:hypothetical protein